ncbi:MAG: hypothetical protein NTX44_11635 [Ignavibacteriales bacterium]|nr:hypothetical protein [Ignavibacteriales bacterium]
MRIKNLFIGFIFTFPLVLVVSVCVGYGYNLFVHSTGVLPWASSFQLAFIFGIALPWIHEWEKHTLLRLDKSLYAALKNWAMEDHRSVNAQIEFLLTDAAQKAERLKKQETARRSDV